MKRILITGILSAAFIATCLIARGASTVYSQNTGSFLIGETTNSLSYWSSVSEVHGIIMSPGDVRVSSTVWQRGPFAIRESRSWTNVAALMDDLPPGEPASSSTSFTFDTHSITVPLSPRQAACVGGIGFGSVVLSLIIGGLLVQRIRANTNPQTG